MPPQTLEVPEHRRVRYLRDQRIRQLGYRDYTHYIHSPAWKQTRARFYRTHPAECICGATGRLLLHHKTYERVGAERLDDLVLLCGECHCIAHELQERGDADLNLEAVLDVVRAQRNRAEVAALKTEREQTLAADNALFAMRLQTLSDARRIALAETTALNRGIDVSREVLRARSVIRSGRPRSAIETSLRVIERKAYVVELRGLRYR